MRVPIKNLPIALCLCLSLCACKQLKTEGETITVDNGIEIPIKACVEANSKIFGSSIDPVAFCKCLIPKFYADLKNDPKKLKLLKEGNWYNINKDQLELVTKYYQGCINETEIKDSTAKFTVTSRMYDGMKKKMIQELHGTEVEEMIDVDKYCDCIINSLQTDFTVNEIMQDNFQETEKFKYFIDSCQRVNVRRPMAPPAH